MAINEGYKRTYFWWFRVEIAASGEYAAARGADRDHSPPVFTDLWRFGFLLHPEPWLLKVPSPTTYSPTPHRLPPQEVRLSPP